VAIDEALEKTIAGHLASGDLTAAATAALQGLGPQILGYLCATLRDDDVAYDVFGHFSEELWKSIGTFRGESSFKTWAYKLVMHSIGRHRRDPYRNRGRALASELRRQLPDLSEAIRSVPQLLQTIVQQASEGRLRLKVEQSGVDELHEELQQSARRRDATVVAAAVLLGGVVWLALDGPTWPAALTIVVGLAGAVFARR
jgi:DNA-directed RNA polymerase specialized sigma24 family protein